MIGNEIFIDANVSFGIQPLPQNNCGRTFFVPTAEFHFFFFFKMHSFAEMKTFVLPQPTRCKSDQTSIDIKRELFIGCNLSFICIH